MVESRLGRSRGAYGMERSDEATDYRHESHGAEHQTLQGTKRYIYQRFAGCVWLQSSSINIPLAMRVEFAHDRQPRDTRIAIRSNDRRDYSNEMSSYT